MSALGVAGGPLSLGCRSEPVTSADVSMFQHGVASGDPLQDSVVLWTRLSLSEETGAVSGEWEVFDSVELGKPVKTGAFDTNAERDHTVKVVAEGLEPATTYYYRFRVGNSASPLGRTRTAPRGETERLRLAVFSCSSYAHGYFHAYRAVAQRADLDAVVHLGDYIYEYGNGEYGSVRGYDPPHELVTLSDYRRRYAQYRRDPDLQLLHQQLPLLAVWDDHEVANDAWKEGAENHQADEGSYAERRRAAERAYFEWLPLRETPSGQVQRSFRFGDLLSIVLADTRHWGRDRQLSVEDPGFDAPERSILGADQEAWLQQELSQADTVWRFLAQQVMFSALPIGVVNTDAWQGYPQNRQRVLQLIRDQAIDNLVILSGDIHMSWALDVVADQELEAYDPETGAGSLAVELVAPSVSSPSVDRELGEELAPLALEERHVRFAQLWKRGYLLLDVDRARVQAEWYLFERVDGPSEQRLEAVFELRAGESFLREGDGPAPDREQPPPLAPESEGRG